jgi:heat shock protein HslJ
MNARPPAPRHGIAATLLAALTTLAGCSLMRPPAVVASAAAVPLLDTHWRLVQLGDQVLDNPAGERDAHVVLSSTNNSVTGDSGCNRLFGHYALENEMLKFDGLGGTKMFCEARMQLEQAFTNALMSTLTWRITGRTLELRDESGAVVATLEAPGSRD